MKKYRLNDICLIEKGKIGINKAVEGGYPLIVTAEKRLTHNEWHFNEPATIVPLVSSTGHGHASIKRLHYAEGKYAVGNILAVLIPKNHNFINAKYLYVYLTVNKQELLVSQMTGAANVSLTLTRLKEVEVHVPDLVTQIEIVKQYETSEELNIELNQQIQERKKFINNLRQKVIQDAISGGLTKEWRINNSNLESAEVLLEKIKSEKRKLVEKNSIRKQKQLPIISDNEIPFKLPKGWVWCRLGDVVYLTRGSSPRPISQFLTTDDQGINWIKIGDTKGVDKYLKSTEQKITPEGAEKSQFVENGDLILSNSMSFGKPYVVQMTGCIHDGWFLIKLLASSDTDYFYYLLSSNLIQNQFSKSATGGVVQNIKSDIVYRTVIPIPPLEEQREIAKHVEDLLKKLDQLKYLNEKSLEIVNLLNKVSLKKLIT